LKLLVNDLKPCLNFALDREHLPTFQGKIFSPGRPITRCKLGFFVEDDLVNLRKKCQTTIAGLSDEKAHQQVAFRWIEEKPMSFLELLLYTMRHGPRTCGPVEPVSRTERHGWSL
jgi:hypothetical protein